MADQDTPDPEFDAMTSRLLRREAMRRAAAELNTTSAPGLEAMLERISAEVTAEAVSRVQVSAGATDPADINVASVQELPERE
jgi:phage shock protein A